MVNEEIRLNRYIAKTGLCSRRAADELIAQSRVSVLRNGEEAAVNAQTGMTLSAGDRVFIDGREVTAEDENLRYLLYHKPAGVVCTTNRRIKDNILDAAGISDYLSYAGRLDKESTGLVLLTNDTAVLRMVTDPKARHEKEYLCEVRQSISDDFLRQMRGGVLIELDDERHMRSTGDGSHAGKTVRTRPCQVEQIDAHRFKIVLTQGFNRQIRRMCRALDYRVVSIHRTRIMHLAIDGLAEGAKRALTNEETELLKAAIHEHR